MKKFFVFAAVALAALLSACQNVETEQVPANDEIVISLNAAIALSDGPATRTVYVPESGKVNWVKGDKIAAKYPAGKDNVSMELVTGEGTTSATFKGKATQNANSNVATKPSDFVFYYPPVSGVGKGGTVTDADNFVLENTFPKVQNSADILFEPNWLYGTAKAQDMLNTSGQVDTMTFSVSMKNVMALLDFTVKGEGALKRVYVTDMDESAPALYGAETLTVENGAVKSLVMTSKGENEYDRTIIAEFNKPVALSATGAHVYVTIFPRTYAKGLRIGFELANGDYMVKKLAESEGFTLASSKVYTVPEVTFASTAESGKGYYDGVEYSYETITDSRDNNVYRIAKLKDNRTWMLDNLRFVPEGITPSNKLADVNNGVWYPVVINADGTAVQFGTDADAARFGYCYNYCTAMGQNADLVYLKLKEILAAATTEQSAMQAALLAQMKEWEGKQGICPSGWHVPTQAEYKTVYAAYGSSLSGIGSSGFVMKDFGYIMVANPSKTSDPAAGSYQGYAFNRLNTSYLILSSPNTYQGAWAIQPNANTNEAKVANMLIRSGAPLRCIQDN